LSGAFIDRIVETKGLDAIDKHKAKKDGLYYHFASVISTGLILTLHSPSAEERTKAKLAASGDY
jgi:hypothetical protein